MSDKIAERVVISSLLNGGSKILSSYAFGIQPEFFTTDLNQSCFRCIKNICERDDANKISIEMICSEAKSIGLENILCTKESVEHLKTISLHPFNEDEVGSFCRKIKFWHTVENLDSRLKKGVKKISELKGDESLLDLVSSIEEDIFGYLPDMVSGDDLVDMSSFSLDHIKFIEENPCQSAGIPTGFPKYDQAIGGGFRRGTVNIVGARPKVGKSTFCLNICRNISQRGVPVLYLDTEMKKESQAVKLVSLISKVDQYKIETGQFKEKENLSTSVDEALGKISTLPFTHSNVSGKKPEEILSIIRRWLSSSVGKDSNGHTNDCVVILDYLKTMDTSDLGDLKEYQYLGDVITKMHNFAVKHDIPVLSTVQLNRDGINREDGSVISGSDRILWLCSSMSFLKKKTDEDVAAGDLMSNGDRKMIVVDTRYGSGMDSSSEYINVVSNMDYCEMVEGRYNYEVLDDAGFVSDDDDDDMIDF